MYLSNSAGGKQFDNFMQIKADAKAKEIADSHGIPRSTLRSDINTTVDEVMDRKINSYTDVELEAMTDPNNAKWNEVLEKGTEAAHTLCTNEAVKTEITKIGLSHR